MIKEINIKFGVYVKPVGFGDARPGSNYSKYKETIRYGAQQQKIRIETELVSLYAIVNLHKSRFFTRDLKEKKGNDGDNLLKAIPDGLCDFDGNGTEPFRPGILRCESQIKLHTIEVKEISNDEEENVIIQLTNYTSSSDDLKNNIILNNKMYRSKRK